MQDASAATAGWWRGWSSLLVVAACAAATVVAIDRVLTSRWPPRILTEVEEGIAALRTVDPTILVIGSSHARTFEVMDRHLDERTGGRQRIAAVPVEFGKLSSYLWVFEHRVLPLMPRYGDRLHRLVLVTEWWDSVADLAGRADGDAHLALNVPSRAWQGADFAGDVLGNGVTDFNRNWLVQRLLRLCGDSVLLRDRGHRRLLKELAGQDPDVLDAAQYDERVQSWLAMTERGAAAMLDPAEMRAFERILVLARAAELETTVLLYPRKPDTMGPAMRQQHLPRFAAAVTELARRHGVRVIDWTLGTSIGDDDFAPDFDHLLPAANEEFCRFALAGELSFLLTPP